MFIYVVIIMIIVLITIIIFVTTIPLQNSFVSLLLDLIKTMVEASD